MEGGQQQTEEGERRKDKVRMLKMNGDSSIF